MSTLVVGDGSAEEDSGDGNSEETARYVLVEER